MDRIDRQDAFSGTREVVDDDQIVPGVLNSYLSHAVPGFQGPLEIRRFKGGQSNPTYQITSPSGQYVLRRKPSGQLLPSAHAVEREFRVICALYPLGFPVPRPRVLCEDETVAGTVFYVMDYVQGQVIWEPHMPGARARDRARVYDNMNAAIARLHQIDVAASGLADFGRADGYVARQVKRWTAQYLASRSEQVDEMDRLMNWLPDAAPDCGKSALVHGDFRLDNCIVSLHGADIVAVLDWELATLGDPLADFTYHLMQWVMPPSGTGAGVGSLLGHGQDAPGLPAMEDYVAAYCARTGRESIANLDTYLAYNFFRLAAIYQGIAGRARDGTAANATAVRMGEQVRPMAETAWRFARKAGA